MPVALPESATLSTASLVRPDTLIRPSPSAEFSSRWFAENDTGSCSFASETSAARNGPDGFAVSPFATTANFAGNGATPAAAVRTASLDTVLTASSRYDCGTITVADDA